MPPPPPSPSPGGPLGQYVAGHVIAGTLNITIAAPPATVEECSAVAAPEPTPPPHRRRRRCRLLTAIDQMRYSFWPVLVLPVQLIAVL